MIWNAVTARHYQLEMLQSRVDAVMSGGDWFKETCEEKLESDGVIKEEDDFLGGQDKERLKDKRNKKLSALTIEEKERSTNKAYKEIGRYFGDLGRLF